LAPPLLGSADYLITHDSGTPAGQTPVVTITAGGVAGTLEIDATNGAVADVTEVLTAATAYIYHADGGTIDLGGSAVDALAATNLTIEDGGTISTQGTFLGLLDGGGITFGSGTGNLLDINNNGAFVNLALTPVISGFGAGDNIIDGEIDYSSIKTYRIFDTTSGQTVEFYSDDNGTTSLGSVKFAANTFNIIASGHKYNIGAGPISSSSGPGGALEFDVCFAAGTHILTPGGEVAVENLQVGDLVVTADGAEHPVKWLGHRSVDLRGRKNPDQHYLVRIKEGAFAPNVPQRDLLVTQEHCIFVDGGLIPARMLVNGRSVILDRGITRFTYYHVELARHGILLAEGLPAESYLDTGNRGNFANAEMAALLPQFAVNEGHTAWAKAAAPLTVDAAKVEPVWRMLDARAQELGLAKVTADPLLTSDPDLRIVTGSGAVIRPLRNTGGRYLFMVPAGESDLRLASRTARPSDTIGPFIDDRRDLGVLAGEIAVYDGRKKKTVDAHLNERSMSGWFDQEHTAHRWTNGHAKLPVELNGLRAPAAILEIQIVNAGPYMVEHSTCGRAIAA
jgi:hypothetical protein